jgi:hypothetical protein
MPRGSALVGRGPIGDQEGPLEKAIERHIHPAVPSDGGVGRELLCEPRTEVGAAHLLEA